MGRTILVTGASRGIGEAIARKFTLNGDTVALNCKSDIKRLDLIVNELKEINPKTIGISADVGNFSEVEAMFMDIGAVDILVNNAGVSYYGLFQDMSSDDCEKIISANLMSVINCSRLAVKHMIRVGSGCIINISSIWGEVGSSCEAVYSAAKGAVNAFTYALAKEIGPVGIRVNAISCGVIDTGMNSFMSGEEKSALVDCIPLGRMGGVGDVAELAFFLSSVSAEYITGQVVRIDGGMI